MLQILQGLSDYNCFSSPTNVCEVQPQQHQVPLVLLGFLEQLCDHTCVLQTPQHHQDHSFLDRGGNVNVFQVVVSHLAT